MDSTMDWDEYIGLNVGGKIYRTSRATLTRYPDSFFTAMLDGGIPSAKDDQGNYLIDQDGKIFRHVLNFLRYGKVVLPDEFKEFDLLEQEADFFLLHELKEALKTSETTGIVRETIGIVDENTSIVYKMSRESLMRETDSYFAKMVQGEIPVPKDSHGNFVIGHRDCMYYFKHVLQYLKHGAIVNEIDPMSCDLESLYRMANILGLSVFKDQITTVVKLPPALSVYYWVKGSECCLYINERQTKKSLRDICQVYAPVSITNRSSGYPIIHVYVGLVDLKKILPEVPVSLESVGAYFSSGAVGFEKTEVSSDCIKFKCSVIS